MPTDFSRIICSAQSVRTAFIGHKPFELWWSLVLLLHGKPEEYSVAPKKRIACVTAGFLFYARLYTVLALVLGGAGIALLSVAGIMGTLYAGTACLLIAGYLLACTSLGRAGAEAYRRGEAQGQVWLIVFLFALAGFLCCFFAAVSVAVQVMGTLPALANLAFTAAALVLGVGSYTLELVYLIAHPPSEL